jgi:hypothetical protein
MVKTVKRQGSSESLRMAILADEIARSLREVALHKKVWDRDRRNITQAVELLKQMRQGREATHNQKSAGPSLPYRQALEAVQAMRLNPGSFESMEKLFEVLFSELEGLQGERNFDVEYVEQFFIALRDVALHLSFSDYSGIFLNAA